MRKYTQFVKEEITIKGNPAIPGEAGDRSGNYLRDTEEEGRRKAGGIDNQMLAMRYGREIMGLVEQNMQLMIGDIINPQTFYGGGGSRNQKQQVQQRFTQLEQLAEDLIRLHYPEILQDVELDIKLLGPNKVGQFMKDEECEQCEMPTYQELRDAEVRAEIHKRKIANNIQQGEAKNAKHMLHHEMVREKLVEIYGDQTANRILDIWNRITDTAEKLDWVVPIDVKAQMMEEQPEGFAGAVKVDWEPKEPKEYEAEEEKPKDEDEKEEDEPTGPCIKARGIDFPMLIHETIKGLYEVISAKGIPQDPRTAEITFLNTDTLADEAEDFRYGPKIAADLRDFINQNREIDKYPNLREHVYGKMIEMPAREFLALMKGILSKTADARTKVDGLVSLVINELDKWELQQVLPDYEDEPKSETPEAEEVQETPEETKEVDYSSMRKSQLQDILDTALDNGDFETVKKISPFIKVKENLMWKIYESEIKRVLKQ